MRPNEELELREKQQQLTVAELWTRYWRKRCFNWTSVNSQFV